MSHDQSDPSKASDQPDNEKKNVVDDEKLHHQRDESLPPDDRAPAADYGNQ